MECVAAMEELGRTILAIMVSLLSMESSRAGVSLLYLPSSARIGGNVLHKSLLALKKRIPL